MESLDGCAVRFLLLIAFSLTGLVASSDVVSFDLENLDELNVLVKEGCLMTTLRYAEQGIAEKRGNLRSFMEQEKRTNDAIDYMLDFTRQLKEASRQERWVRLEDVQEFERRVKKYRPDPEFAITEERIKSIADKKMEDWNSRVLFSEYDSCYYLRARDADFLRNNAKRASVVSDENHWWGQYEIIQEGAGNATKKGDSFSYKIMRNIHGEVTLEGKITWDSSMLRNHLTDMMGNMKKGEKRLVWVIPQASHGIFGLHGEEGRLVDSISILHYEIEALP